MAQVTLPLLNEQTEEAAIIAGLLEKIGLNVAEIIKWFILPLSTKDGKIPLDLIANGRGHELIDRLTALAQGNIGS